MLTPWRSRFALLGLAGAAAAALLLLGTGGSVGTAAGPAGSWSALLGGPQPDVGLGQRAIVVLKAPSLAQRVARAGGIVSTATERRWTAAAYAAQQQLILRLVFEGVAIKPEYSFTRVLDGFSAQLDPSAVAALERSKDVAGVYPVRAAFPAAVSSSALDRVASAGDFGVRLPGYDGRGVTIALLDTGVDRGHPSLRGHVLPGIDVLGGGGTAAAGADPLDPSLLERHGTELAGLLVGSGPDGARGVATGATVLPIRVAGWQVDARGGYAVYARSDQLIAGLERAVDPNGDGDAHDAARVALVGLAERYASFADSPEARAVDGALALDTVVVMPAGNDGAAGPGYGSVAGPGGAVGSLTVGATDERRTLPQARVVLRSGLKVLLDRTVPVLGEAAPAHPLDLSPAAPRRPGATRTLTGFFDAKGFSLVAGKAALVPVGDDPVAAARRAAQAGASAVVLYGRPLPAASLGLDASLDVPVVGLPAGPVLALLASVRAGVDAGVSVGPATERSNPAAGRVAAFSSRGLAFDGRVEPDLVAPGVALATAEPGRTGDGSARYATVSGSSASAALAAGAAAVLAQERPRLDAPALQSLLVGSAHPVAGDGVTAQGAGVLDLGAAAAAEVAASPAALALGASTGKGWRATETLTLRNVSTRRLRVVLSSHPERGNTEPLTIAIQPARLVLRQGVTREVKVTARLSGTPVGELGAGSIEIRPVGGQRLRIPWLVDYRPYRGSLIGSAALSSRSFTPSDSAPARLAVRVGAVVRGGDGAELVPASRLDVQLWRADGTGLGLLARVRDLLPGRYTFGLTGRDPSGKRLPPGRYRVRLVAWPTQLGKPSVRSVSFTVE